MVIHKIKAREVKGKQQFLMVLYCEEYWCDIYNSNYSYYDHVININTRRWDDENDCYVTTSYYFNPNKW